ncbi:MAG: DUF4038 domain-containing protein [Candidatus Omnitrophica bacterium]|nr:DUF4038 domain-containing protein [Candidatus Omnitrophota bacterium]
MSAAPTIVFPAASWDTSQAPAEVGLAESILNQFVSAIGGDGVLVKDGYLVKTWGNPSARGDWASAAKPVMSTLLLFAVQEGLLNGVDDLVKDWWLNLDGSTQLIAKDASMTFRHLANMTSSYARGEVPGAAWAYNDYAIMLYCQTMKKVFGLPSSSTLETAARTANRLGPLQFEDGALYATNRGGCGIDTSPRDFARIGWFWLNRGNWNGQPLLDSQALDTYRNPAVAGNLPRTTQTGTDYLGIGSVGGTSDQTPYGPGIYGFNWWFNALAGTTSAMTWPDVPGDVFMANGHFDKEIMVVIPRFNMVVAARGQWGAFQPGGATAAMNRNLKLLADAVQPAGLRGPLQANPQNPRWLIYSDGMPFFLAGAGDPEGFLYRGTRNADGTRNGDQMGLINKMVGTGANAIYVMAVRSHGGDGAASENPFENSNPAQPLDNDILNQWESWFAEMDRNGIAIFFFIYDDSARIWNTGDVVSAAEQAFVEQLVNRFEHHNHLIWVIGEEYGERYTPQRVKDIAAIIRSADGNTHPIAVHKNNGLNFSEFADDPSIDQFAIQYNVPTAQELHDGMVQAWQAAQGKFNLNMSEAASHGTGTTARLKNWAVAMGGAYVMVIGMDIASTALTDLEDLGRLVDFFSQTDFDGMLPDDSLALGATQYVLANPPVSYIAYTSAASGSLGIRNMSSGNYNLMWYDPVTGSSVSSLNNFLADGDQTWVRPAFFGAETALYVYRSTAGTLCMGDTNQDQAVDLTDAVRLIQHLLGQVTLTGQALTAADSNQDGSVDLLDVIRIIRDLLGLEPLPACQ